MAILLISGCAGAPEGGQRAPEVSEKAPEATQPPPAISEPAAQTHVTVYFSNATAEKLVPVQRAVPKDMAMQPMRVAIEALIAGPAAGENLGAVMPKGTKLRQLNVIDGTAHVNFSREFRENHPGGSTGELLTLYALANTLTEFPQVKTVQIWVENKQLQEFIHMDLRKGLQRRVELIQAKP